MELKFTGKTGGSVTKTEYTSTTPRKWTKEEEDWALEKDSEGVPRKDIAKALNRSETSVSIKLKRLKKERSIIHIMKHILRTNTLSIECFKNTSQITVKF